MSWKTVLTRCSADTVDIYSTQPRAHPSCTCQQALLRQSDLLTANCILAAGSSNWDNGANQVKSFATIPSIIKEKGPKDDMNELLHLPSIN